MDFAQRFERVLSGEIQGDIVCGDCLKVMARMPDGCADLVVADYPFGFSDNPWDLPIGAALDLALKTLPQIQRLLRVGGSTYLMWGAFEFIADLAIAVREYSFQLINWITWRFDLGYHPRTKFKHWSCHILYLAKGIPDMFNADEIRIPTTNDPRNNPNGAIPSDVWLISEPRKNSIEYQGHRGQKPERLLERIIKTSSNPSALVFDPFMGSGTTAVVADRLGRRWFGCDINPDYVRMSLDRISQDRLRRSQLTLL